MEESWDYHLPTYYQAVGICFQRNLLLTLQNFFLAEPILKYCSLNLFSMEPSFRYCEMLTFRDLLSHKRWVSMNSSTAVNLLKSPVRRAMLTLLKGWRTWRWVKEHSGRDISLFMLKQSIETGRKHSRIYDFEIISTIGENKNEKFLKHLLLQNCNRHWKVKRTQ